MIVTATTTEVNFRTEKGQESDRLCPKQLNPTFSHLQLQVFTSSSSSFPLP